MRYYKIEGIIEIGDDMSLDIVSDLITLSIDNELGTFGGGIKEVDSEGNDILNN